jgi:hypothetical protein
LHVAIETRVYSNNNDQSESTIVSYLTIDQWFYMRQELINWNNLHVMLHCLNSYDIPSTSIPLQHKQFDAMDSI